MEVEYNFQSVREKGMREIKANPKEGKKREKQKIERHEKRKHSVMWKK